MPVSLDAVEADALQLTAPERAQLIERLIASVAPAPLHPEWAAEIARRVAAMDADVGESIPAEQALAEVRALIDAHEREKYERSA